MKLVWMCGWSLTYAAFVWAGANVLSNMTIAPSPVSRNIMEALGSRQLVLVIFLGGAVAVPARKIFDQMIDLANMLLPALGSIYGRLLGNFLP